MTTLAVMLVDGISRTRARLDHMPAASRPLKHLRRWQIARMRHTYADLLDDERYHDAVELIMGAMPRQAARPLRLFLSACHRLLSDRALSAVTGALELEALSVAIDIDVARALGSEPLNARTYAIAYRAASSPRNRQRQLWLRLRTARALIALANRRGIRTALRAARLPAALLGLRALHTFLERARAAFETMSDTEDLLRLIEQRELKIIQNLFDGLSQPFRTNCL
jgi:hypothetical protein